MKILETHISFEKGIIKQVVVLVDYTSSNSKPYSDIRAIMATNVPKMGYTMILPTDQVSQELIEKVADFGAEINNVEDYFPNWKKYRSK